MSVPRFTKSGNNTNRPIMSRDSPPIDVLCLARPSNHESKRLEPDSRGRGRPDDVVFQYSTTSRNGWNVETSSVGVRSSGLSVLNHESKRLEPGNRAMSLRSCNHLSVLNHESKRLEHMWAWAIGGGLICAFSTQPRVETAGTLLVCPTCHNDRYLSVLNHESKRLERAPAERDDARQYTFQYSTTSRNGWNG